jgi:ABC-type Fe3+-hydroxamate transport system substrate-binding protein
VRRRDLFGLSAGAVAGLAFAPPLAEARPFTDSAGRRIDVPDEVRRVFPAEPPASLTLYTAAPEKMLGWTRVRSPEARPFLPQRYAELPELGRLTGRGNTVNLENVVRLMPDLVLDVGDTSATYVSLAERVQEQTHISAVLISGHLADTAATFRSVGALLGVSERTEKLARYAEGVLAEIQSRTGTIPLDKRPSIYVARGPHGLETAVAGSIGSEVVDLVGARNVAGKETAPRAIGLSLDCDFQHLLPEIRDLFDGLIEGYDVAVGSRFSRHSVLLNYPFAKILANRGFHMIARIVLIGDFRDLTNNLKLMRREVARDLLLREPGFAVNAETGLQPLLMGYRVKEVPISWIGRGVDMGVSSFRVLKAGGGYWRVLYGLWLCRFLRTGPYRALATGPVLPSLRLIQLFGTIAYR